MGKFSWDWMLSNLISYGILDYYQCNVALNRRDIMLYRMGRGMGPIVSEAHIIKSMSGSRYRVMSFDFDTVTCVMCNNVHEVCRYIIHVFIPQEYRKVEPGEYLRRLRERREERSEAMKTSPEQSIVAGEFDWEIVKIKNEMMDKIDEIRWERTRDRRAGQAIKNKK